VTGRNVLEGYGLTETSPVVCVNPIGIDAFTGTIGLPISSTDVDVRDADGQSLAPEEPGELCVRGPQVMQGYWQQPEETAAVFFDGGVPDEASGEAVKLFVVADPEIEVDPQALRRHCREHLTGYKVPRHIEFIDELPKTNVGKIMRRELRDRTTPEAA
jgi:long-chain acyl-CoA synthetase